jgi:hypothetical protein
MNSSQTTINKKAIGASVVLLSMVLTIAPATAQDASAGGYSSSSFIGADHDSLLPPEVVPLDPATASSMSAAQAASRANALGSASSVASEGQQVPGLVPSSVPQGMQTAKDARQAAFNSLYGQGSIQPINQPMQAGGVQQNFVPGLTNPAMNGSGSAPYGAPSQPMIATQSQRLTGAPKQQPKIRDIKRAGVSNTLSAVAGFGAGALTAGALIQPANPMVGLGIFGLTMTGFGVRNAFRF